ncbi:MAG: hypothetical protein QW372_06605 [Nitrososphaerales archaeon]
MIISLMIGRIEPLSGFMKGSYALKVKGEEGKRELISQFDLYGQNFG